MKNQQQPEVPSESPTATAPHSAILTSDTLLERPDLQIGRYKLLQKIGEGGMGRVWMAEQVEPVRRYVALKLIKPGMDSSLVLARFEAERQALALMDHPNIAKVLDAGATPNGSPYFVMELVKGMPLVEFCDEQRLSIRERLELFVQVCQAVQHAHQKGIIHRDLKPGNVLVALYDGRPVPKVIDFGVAKATGPRLTEHTLFTEFGAVVGTLEYMSPEQAELNQLDIDTRSDIYSLGVLLYQLLTGTTPLTREALREGAFQEMLRRIREEEPPKPSTRLSQSKARLGSISAQRKLDPEQLTSVVRGDLDWIVMKTIEKDRARRYETANGLARDLQRYLADEPVVARPPSAGYRVLKAIKRHKLAFAASGAIALALMIGLGFSTWSFVKEKQARQDAAKEASKSKEVAQFLKDMLAGVGPSVALGRDTQLLRDILDKTAKRVGEDLTNHPDVQAQLRNTIGGVYEALAEFQQASNIYALALAARTFLSHDDPEIAESLAGLAGVLIDQGKPADAEPMLREALGIVKARLGPENIETVRVSESLGVALRDQSSVPKLTEAEKVLRENLAILRNRAPKDEKELATLLDTLGSVARMQGDYTNAETLQREALSILRRVLGDTDPDVAIALNSLGLVLRPQEKLSEAEAAYREALSIWRKLVKEEHPEVARLLNNLSMVLSEKGDFVQAEKNFRDVLQIRKKLLGEESRDVATSYHNLGLVLEREGKLSEAEEMYRQGLAIRKKVLGEDHPWISASMEAVAGVLLLQDKDTEATALYLESINLRRKVLPPDSADLAASLSNFGTFLVKQKKWTEAEAIYREVLNIRKKVFSSAHPAVADALGSIALMLSQQGKFAEAEEAQREALAILESKAPQSWLAFESRSRLGDILVSERKYAEAEPLLLSGYEGMKGDQEKLAFYDKPRLTLAMQYLVRYYEQTGDTNKAGEWQQKLDDKKTK